MKAFIFLALLSALLFLQSETKSLRISRASEEDQLPDKEDTLIANDPSDLPRAVYRRPRGDISNDEDGFHSEEQLFGHDGQGIRRTTHSPQSRPEDFSESEEDEEEGPEREDIFSHTTDKQIFGQDGQGIRHTTLSPHIRPEGIFNNEQEGPEREDIFSHTTDNQIFGQDGDRIRHTTVSPHLRPEGIFNNEEEGPEREDIVSHITDKQIFGQDGQGIHLTTPSSYGGRDPSVESIFPHTIIPPFVDPDLVNPHHGIGNILAGGASQKVI